MIKQQVLDGEVVWPLDLGRLDAGQSKTSFFYVKNIGGELIEDFEVEVEPLDREGVFAEVVKGSFRPRFGSGDVQVVEVKVTASVEARMGPRRVGLTVRGFLVEEEYRGW